MLAQFAVRAIAILGLSAAEDIGQERSLGEKLVEFCESHKGEQVSTGECSALANTGLRTIGAKTRGKDDPNEGDYTWGQPVLVWENTPTGPQATTGRLGGIRPGDVIQFRDTKWEGPRPGGKGRYSLVLKHHTAIVAEAENGGQVLKIYQQNYGGKKIVMGGTICPRHLKEGWIRIYRPVPASAKKS